MRRRPQPQLKNRATNQHNGVVRSRFRGRTAPLAQRSRGLTKNRRNTFMPPEDWHEPIEDDSVHYRVVEQEPGDGYAHVVTVDEVRERLAQLPEDMLRPLHVVQLSRMTRKKRSFPCYGMQWGSTLYLYPIEKELVEYFVRAPRPQELQEAAMFGGRWVERGDGGWKLIWTPETIRDFYLNNVLIHELGHLLDNRNTSYLDRERYAEWFAIHHGYKPSRRANLAEQAARKLVRRRHHAS